MVAEPRDRTEDGDPRGADGVSGSDCRPADLESELWAQSDFYHRELQRLGEEIERLSEIAAERDQLLGMREAIEGQLRDATEKLSKVEGELDQALVDKQDLGRRLRTQGDDLRAMEALYGDAQARADELAERLEAEQANAGRSAAQRDKAREQAKRNKERLARIERSVSWRVTRPLRSLSKLVRWRR